VFWRSDVRVWNPSVQELYIDDVFRETVLGSQMEWQQQRRNTEILRSAQNDRRKTEAAGAGFEAKRNQGIEGNE